MKVTISIDEQSLGNELKCASDFLLAMANERNQANGFPTFGETPKQPEEVEEAKEIVVESKKAPAEVVEEISHEEKVAALADKVVEATQVREESEGEDYTLESVVSMTEEEMKNVPTQVLYDILTGHFNVDPAERPGKNTNAKLRGLLLSTINAEAKEEETVAEEENVPQEKAIEPQEKSIEPQGAEEVPEDAAPAEDVPEVTIDMLRAKATELIRLKKRQVVADAFAACGATNFGTLQSERYNDFYAFVCQA
nr:MAG TPA: hypothetical protein [Caudoviricetes sp.]